jgi:hypothetical protein
MTIEHMLTTVDNPFDPVTQFEAWNVWDQTAGYHTLSYLGRVVKTSDELSEADQSLAYEQAMQDIVNDNGGLYKVVVVPSVVATDPSG